MPAGSTWWRLTRPRTAWVARASGLSLANACPAFTNGVRAPATRATLLEVTGGLLADHLECDIHVAARGVRVRADLLVRLAHECGELVLRNALVLYLHLDGDAEAAAVPRADRDSRGDGGLGRIALRLLGDEVERAAEAGGIAGGEEMLGRRSARLARAAELLRHREVGLDEAVAGLRVAVAAAARGSGGGEEGFDPIHGGTPVDSGWGAKI